MRWEIGFVFVLLAWPFLVSGQTDSLNTQNITVIGSYNPAVTQALKLRTLPVLNNTEALQKIPVQYRFITVPVASTFTPSKGKAAGLERREPEHNYNSFASLAMGYFFTSQADLYTGLNFDRGSKRLDLGLHHKSALAQLKFSPLPTAFYQSHLNAAWSHRERDFNWKLAADIGHNLQHWYGLVYRSNETDFTDSLDVAQYYLTGHLFGKIKFEDSFVKDASVQAQTISDATSASESSLHSDFNLEFPVRDYFGTIGTFVDVVQGRMGNAPVSELDNSGTFNYGRLQLGIRPGLRFDRKALRLFVGANLVYATDLEIQEGSLYVYPNLSGDINLSDKALVAFASLDGSLTQNSFQDYARQNPFISPTLLIRPTDTKYHFNGGFRGQLKGVFGYALHANYEVQQNAPLFMLNPVNEMRTDAKAYNFGNSFQVVYQDFNTLGFTAEIQWMVNRNFNLQLSGSIYEYESNANAVVYNLPNHEANLLLDFRPESGWGFWMRFILMGERQDLMTSATVSFLATPLVLDAYFDASTQLSYRINTKWNAFLQANNVLNTNYQRWAHFPVQGFQLLGGVGYRFDW
ncbi:MAG: hypothetical protein RLZZ241_1169 [Bacteroidota bacterium]